MTGTPLKRTNIEKENRGTMGRVEGKTVLVTGGAGGIGRASAIKLAEEGAQIVIADLDGTAAATVAQELTASGHRAHSVAMDVTSYEDIDRGVKEAAEIFGQLDVMFNNAGIAGGKHLLQHDPARDYLPMIRVCQDGVYYGILAAARQFVAQGTPGTIINTSSIYGQTAATNAFSYGAAKSAVISFTRSAAYDLGPYGIRCVAITPGRVNTPMLNRLSDDMLDLFAREQARGRLTEPEEIADVVCFLASSESNAINGTVVNVEDGYSAFKGRFDVTFREE